MSPRQQRIASLLEARFAPLEYQLEDESALHAGHAGAASGGGHYRLRIVAGAFEGAKRIDRHRLVYDCLVDLIHSEIHALAITALAPSEVPGARTD